jgi:uncharacterized protein
MLRWFEHSQVYFPFREFESSADVLGRPWQEVQFEAKDGTPLHAWFFPAATNAPRAHLAVLLCHGNGGNISHRLEYYQVLLGLGLNVFAFDYRGYGRSAGRPSEAGTYLDAEAAYDWLLHKGFKAEQIVPLGESLGGAIATELAVRRPVGGLILQSTFTSVPDIGAELFPFLPVRWICSIQYNTLSKLPKVKVPVLVAHSPADTIVPFAHGEKLFAAANEPKLFCKMNGDHNDSVAEVAEYAQALERFFQTATRR